MSFGISGKDRGSFLLWCEYWPPTPGQVPYPKVVSQHKFESMEREGEGKAEGINLGRQEGAQNTKIIKTNYLEPIYIWGMTVELTCFLLSV